MSKLSEWWNGLALKAKANAELNRQKAKAKDAIDGGITRLLNRIDTNNDGKVTDGEIQAVLFDQLGKAGIPDRYLIPIEIAVQIGIVRIDSSGTKGKQLLVKMGDNIKKRIDGARF